MARRIAIIGLGVVALAIVWWIGSAAAVPPIVIVWIALYLLDWKVDRLEEKVDELQQKLEDLESETSVHQSSYDDACIFDGDNEVEEDY